MAISGLHYSATSPHQKTQGQTYPHPRKGSYGFKISNAIHADGTEANLQYIDFIKIQCGVLAKSGWLGEVSTEVFSFEDLTK